MPIPERLIGLAPGDGVQIWRIPLEVPPARLAALRSLLSAEEVARADRFRLADDRRRFTVAHAALRQILAWRLAVPPEDLCWSRAGAGKPRLAEPAGVRFNLSHAGELGLLAVTAHREVGIDVERLRPGLDVVAFAARYFGPAEARWLATAGPAEIGPRFLRLWTRKEAVVKAAGRRLVQGLRVQVDATVVHDASGAIPGTWLLCDVPVPAGYVAAVALQDVRPYEVTVCDFTPARS